MMTTFSADNVRLGQLLYMTEKERHNSLSTQSTSEPDVVNGTCDRMVSGSIAVLSVLRAKMVDGGKINSETGLTLTRVGAKRNIAR